MSATKRFHQVANDALVKISEHSPAGSKLALVIYTPGEPEQDIILRGEGLDDNEVISALRRRGFSIDGDNAYKRDLCDSIVGALAFGKQRSTPPPTGHWLEQFYDIGLAEANERDAAAPNPEDHIRDAAKMVDHSEGVLGMVGQHARDSAELRRLRTERDALAAELEVSQRRLHEVAKHCAGVEAELATLKAGAGEPVGEIDEGDDGVFVELLADRTFRLGQKVYAAPQPAPDVIGLASALELIAHKLESARVWDSTGWGEPYASAGTQQKCLNAAREALAKFENVKL